MTAYFNSGVSDLEIKQLAPKLMTDAKRFDSVETRSQLVKRGILETNFVRFVYRPFDCRWLYWEPETKLLDEKRSEYFPHVVPENVWLAACQQNRKQFDPPLVCVPLAETHIIERTNSMFPMLLRPDAEATLFASADDAESFKYGDYIANLSAGAQTYLNSFEGAADTPHLFHHAIAVMHAPAYAAENASALRQDWPRIPLPAKREQLVASGDLGRQVAALLDPEALVAGVTSGKLRPELKGLGVLAKVGGGQLRDNDFAVNARWGYDQSGTTMPGPGRIAQRPWTAAEAELLGPAASERLGPDTLDIYLNEAAYWRNVPRAVWQYTLGGYQVLKKWLSYREAALLGRPLSIDEVDYFSQVVRRIAALLLLGPQLDANYAEVKADTYAWPTAGDA
jgi:hypothetical protein